MFTDIFVYKVVLINVQFFGETIFVIKFFCWLVIVTSCRKVDYITFLDTFPP